MDTLALSLTFSVLLNFVLFRQVTQEYRQRRRWEQESRSLERALRQSGISHQKSRRSGCLPVLLITLFLLIVFWVLSAAFG